MSLDGFQNNAYGDGVYNFMAVPLEKAGAWLPEDRQVFMMCHTSIIDLFYSGTYSRTFSSGTELGYTTCPPSLPSTKWSAPWPSGLLIWLMSASARAHSEWHVDANGLGTYVHQIYGWKIWIIAGKWRIPSKFKNAWDDKADLDDIEVILLGPGDKL